MGDTCGTCGAYFSVDTMLRRCALMERSRCAEDTFVDPCSRDPAAAALCGRPPPVRPTEMLFSSEAAERRVPAAVCGRSCFVLRLWIALMPMLFPPPPLVRLLCRFDAGETVLGRVLRRASWGAPALEIVLPL